MKDYIPDALFDPFNEPVGDKRWWHTELYKHFNLEWMGPEADSFSPHNLSEEEEINLAILEGRLQPRNKSECVIRGLIDVPRAKSQWPHKWVTCKKCGADVNLPGYPAGKQNKFTDAMARGCYQLIDHSEHLWIWPKICQLCADKREAKPPRPKKPVLPSKVRSPHND